ncbi:DUF6054 family protein [Alkalibacter saccharofermentans]|uniref:Uncharacterized protein n=1 Tax=Alkalibacter saccharofermentans DSM 14828 TaxID=1120975 RepID=A0A1M4X3Y9_9FIRM|nr:DUF6054 family protein [Alkalibacter saccharofermentans]SHE88228.1 hypothetical protein SAMN02746064_01416 [Alkalibacter saccharofermentans DSM 14828]
MASLSMYGPGDVESVSNALSNDILNSGVSCELVDTINRTVGQTSICIMVFEKYYMRSSNRASLTVSVIGDNKNVCVDAIGAGGGQGAFFRFSWGAEEDFVAEVEKSLKKFGFR